MELLETLGQEKRALRNLSGEEVGIKLHKSVKWTNPMWPSWILVVLYQLCKVPSFVKLRNNCRETVPCYYHSDCQDGLQCVVGHCGEPEYFRALAEMPCTEVRVMTSHGDRAMEHFRMISVTTWGWDRSAVWTSLVEWRVSRGGIVVMEHGGRGAVTTSEAPSLFHGEISVT